MPALKTYVESRTPVLYPFRPVLRIGSYKEALDHYADWLGFRLEWDWREAPGQPVIAAFSRDGVEFMVNEYPDTLGPIELHLNVKNLDALVEEWNVRRPGAAEVRSVLGPPLATAIDVLNEFPGYREAFDARQTVLLCPLLFRLFRRLPSRSLRMAYRVVDAVTTSQVGPLARLNRTSKVASGHANTSATATYHAS